MAYRTTATSAPARPSRRNPAIRRRSAAAFSYILLIALLVVANFFLPRLLPGRPLASLVDPRSAAYVSDVTERQAVESYYGLDRPLPDQFARYMGDLVHGDLGTSITYNSPVTSLLRDRVPWTFLLVGSGVTIAVGLGTAAGIRSGWRRGRSPDKWVLGAFLVVDSLPVYFLASAVAFAGGVRLGWLPFSGARTPYSDSWSLFQQALDIGRHLVLPGLVMAVQFATQYYLIMRASMVRQLGSDHLLLGRAKGLSERILKYRYAARNALLPTVTVFAAQAGVAVTAAIFIERVFTYPGVGRLMFESVGERDYPLMQGCFLVISVLVVTANLIADIAYRHLDPRTAR